MARMSLTRTTSADGGSCPVDEQLQDRPRILLLHRPDSQQTLASGSSNSDGPDPSLQVHACIFSLCVLASPDRTPHRSPLHGGSTASLDLCLLHKTAVDSEAREAAKASSRYSLSVFFSACFTHLESSSILNSMRECEPRIQMVEVGTPGLEVTGTCASSKKPRTKYGILLRWASGYFPRDFKSTKH